MLDTMYKKTNARPSRNNSGRNNNDSSWGGRPRRNSSGGNSGGGGSRFGGGGRSRFGGKRGFTGNVIDVKRFINKAEPTKPEEAFEPENSFEDFKIHKTLKKSIAHRGFTVPTPIQDKAIPAVLEGKDVIGLANTGTGKTAAFLVPMIHKILNNPTEKVLIVVPIRELAIQIQEEFQAFVQRMNIGSVVVVGGANIQRQIKGLQRNPNVVIGTPGRLKDLIDRKRLNLSDFNNVVLDEADRMLDMGFINDVKWLLSLVAEKRQMMLFSATFSREIEGLVKTFLNNPEKISLKTRETSKQIDQDIIRVNHGKDKTELFNEVLVEMRFEKMLVFTRTKHGADKLCKKLHQSGYKADAIHGDKPHNKRQRVLQQFKKSSIDILVATDVAARGLDIPDVSHVINFDIPATYEDYVHRIGRTGRAEKQGTALTFVG